MVRLVLPLLLVGCALRSCAAYFDIQLLSEIAQLKYNHDSEIKEARLNQRRLQAAAAANGTGTDTHTFWERLNEKGKGPGKRAAITTLIAIIVVIVVCVCCWCIPILDIACWGKSRDDNALNETYLPTDKPPTVVSQLSPGIDIPAAAGDDVRRRPIHVEI